jgi:dual specificity phosphatase 12
MFTINLPNDPKYEYQSMDEVYPNMFVGSFAAAKNSNLLQQHGITHVVNATGSPRSLFPDLTYHFVPIEDTPNVNILQHIPSTVDFIHNALSQNGRVLVHCMAGISRSASLAIAYIMKTDSLTFEQAFSQVTTKRRIICPNLGFRRQLDIYHACGFTLDERNTSYRRFTIDNMAYVRRSSNLIIGGNVGRYWRAQHDTRLRTVARYGAEHTVSAEV